MVKRKGIGKGKGKGYKNIIGKDPKVHSQSAKGIKQPQKIPKMPKQETSDYTFEQLQIVSDIIDEIAIEDQARLFSDTLFGDTTGHRLGIPYYLEEGKIKFDKNADYQQESMNDAMKYLMDEAGLTLEDLKDENALEYSWNANADSYLSHASAEVDMPKNNLPIWHHGDSGEYDMQIDSVEDEYERLGLKDKGINLSQFRKMLVDDYSLKDDFIYIPINYAGVISIPKELFILRLKATGKKLDKEELDIIKNYNAER